MRAKESKLKAKASVDGQRTDRTGSSEAAASCPASEAFLEEAKKEPRRKLLIDHIRTIKTLRDEKRFTFRAIAGWLGKRGVETDHSAVYRTYLSTIPDDQRDPGEDWTDVDEPGFGDEDAR
jgi:hypothetical protein